MARSPAQEAPPVRQKHAGAAGLQESRHRYGLGVPKLREERVTVGVHDKTVPSIERAQFEGVPIRKLGEEGAEAPIVANFGQRWPVDARISSDFSSAARVNTCIGEAQSWKKKKRKKQRSSDTYQRETRHSRERKIYQSSEPHKTGHHI